MPSELASLMLCIENLIALDLSDLDPPLALRVDLAKAIEQAEARLAPSTPAAVGEMIFLVREGLDVPAPTDKGLQIFLRVLDQIPADLLPLATKRVLETHRYNTYPKPADFLLAIKPELDRRIAAANRLRYLRDRIALADKWRHPREGLKSL